jgi:glycolate oxidase FAD binding subunit
MPSWKGSRSAFGTGVNEHDLSELLRKSVLQAVAENVALNLTGGGSKSFYGRAAQGLALPLSGHAGILHYEPTELVITARCGTSLAEIEAVLDEHRQMLAFEPPRFGARATVGGAIASGLSGPRRPFTGSARDFVLGVKMLNGKGEILSFGGEVMKNVAGFDVARLMTGAMGTLGVLLEISLKVLPKPACEATVCREMPPATAIETMNRWAGQPLPLSGLCHDGQRLYARFSGAEAAVEAVCGKLGGERLPDAARFWEDLREQRLAFFRDADTLWRLSLPPATPLRDLPGDVFLDWCGAQRWLKSDAPADVIFETARRHGGHASRFRSTDRHAEAFQPLQPGLKRLHQSLKRAFDPHGIFNPGRLYRAW